MRFKLQECFKCIEEGYEYYVYQNTIDFFTYMKQVKVCLKLVFFCIYKTICLILTLLQSKTGRLKPK